MEQLPSAFRTTVDSRGRLLLPAEVRQRLGIGDGDRLVVTVEDDALRVAKIRDVVRRHRGTLAAHGRSLVDELIAERRAEARREAAGE